MINLGIVFRIAPITMHVIIVVMIQVSFCNLELSRTFVTVVMMLIINL
jgi:hypothetical protein